MDFTNLHLEHIQFLEIILFRSLGREVQVKDYFFLSGGCINQAVQVATSAGAFFVKWNETTDEQFFACEVQGLEALRQAGEIPVPEVIGYGRSEQRPYLILELLSFNQPKPDYWTRFGASLARLHQHTQPEFGFRQNNFIGALPQNNEPMVNGIEFFIERRLKPQAGLALYNQAMPQALYDQFQKLYARLPQILPDEKPALLHGDLWHGNVITGNDGYACLIDPAVHYGNREAEIAFTHLFGDFDEDFYEAYGQAFPLQPGFEQRRDIYNLYPLLVHVNLFGSGYLSGVERIIKKFS